MHLDGSGMDFRTMLKKKKYAKNVADNEDPDWGSLKKVERDGPDSDEADKKVKKNLYVDIFYIFK